MLPRVWHQLRAERLNALRDSARRPQEVLGADGPAGAPEPSRWGEPIWLQPYPDSLLEGLPDRADGPDVRYDTKEAVALAFVSGLQRLPPHQRAVLVLRDVLGYRAAEAGMLDTSEASVNSALQRARAAVEQAAPRSPEASTLPSSQAQRRLLTRFTEAFERGEIDTVVSLLSDDAWIRMPPEPHEYQGHAAIAEFLETRSIWQPGRSIRLVPTRANGSPAFAYYLGDPNAGVARAGGLFVLTLDDDRPHALRRHGRAATVRPAPHAAAVALGVRPAERSRRSVPRRLVRMEFANPHKRPAPPACSRRTCSVFPATVPSPPHWRGLAQKSCTSWRAASGSSASISSAVM